MVKTRQNHYSVRFRWIFAVYGFGQTGSNIRLNGSVDSVWTPYAWSSKSHRCWQGCVHLPINATLNLFLMIKIILKLKLKKSTVNYFDKIMSLFQNVIEWDCCLKYYHKYLLKKLCEIKSLCSKRWKKKLSNAHWTRQHD